MLVAFAYSAVGHGGASGYLALMAIAKIPSKEASTLALALNVVVSAVSFWMFRRAKYFEWQLAWPLLVGSVPAAFLGGKLRLTDTVHQWVLAVVLGYAAITLILRQPKVQDELQDPDKILLIAIGAGIGLLSGMVGVGGGIFLSPVLLLAGWANAKTTAATSALFILCNSVSGLAARIGVLGDVLQKHSPLLLIAVTGAVAGAWLGSLRLTDLWLRRALGIVMLVAVVKMVSP